MAQSLSNILLHLIFSTKNREPFINETIESDLYAYMTSIAAAKGSFVHKIGGISDHVHLFLTLPRTISISNLLEEIKKDSSKWIKTKSKKHSNFSWQKGYGAFSVSASMQNTVTNYISNQKEHHKTHTFQEEYLKFLQLYNIPYDEKYVWD